jgi:dynein heavy chain
MLFRSRGEPSQHQVRLEDSPSRRYRKPENQGKIESELLGAGDDPMAKN